jgi:hypothetical protein
MNAATYGLDIANRVFQLPACGGGIAAAGWQSLISPCAGVPTGAKLQRSLRRVSRVAAVRLRSIRRSGRWVDRSHLQTVARTATLDVRQADRVCSSVLLDNLKACINVTGQG